MRDADLEPTLKASANLSNALGSTCNEYSLPIGTILQCSGVRNKRIDIVFGSLDDRHDEFDDAAGPGYNRWLHQITI